MGDNLYLQSIVRELVSRGEDLEVCTDFPELFRFDVKFAEFTRGGIDILAHYAQRRSVRATNQWQDIKICSKVDAELKIEWKVKNQPLIDSLPDNILFVVGGRPPMHRLDGFGKELLPDEKAFNKKLKELRKDYFAINIGKAERTYDVDVDLDLADQTSVTDLMDIASVSKMFYGQCSFIIPLAESFDAELLCIWARAGLNSTQPVIKGITPKKIFSKDTSKFILDDEICNL